METRLHFHTADAVGQHGFGMRVYDAVDAGVLFEYLAVDAALFVSLHHTFLDWRGIVDVVFHYVGWRGDEGGGNGVREEECARVVRVAEGYVTVRVHDSVIVQDVVCGYELLERRRVFEGHWCWSRGGKFCGDGVREVWS